jgi:hypothetical protein
VKRIVAVILALFPPTAGEARADAKETLEAARAAYYSLRREGLASFSCLVTPNWDLLLASRWRTDPAASAKAYKVFDGITFGVEVTPGQRAKVLHADPPTSPEIDAAALKRLTGGLEQTLSGFFDTWAPFVLTSPIPPITAEVSETRELWSVDYKEGATSVGLAMRKDYTIDASHIVTAQFDSLIQPQFTRLTKGLLLTAVQGQYRQLPSGAPVSLQMRIEYQEVSGFQLPRRLHVMTHDGHAVGLMDLAFGTCQARHR